jgi:tRNA pseudouridine55 synthase
MKLANRCQVMLVRRGLESAAATARSYTAMPSANHCAYVSSSGSIASASKYSTQTCRMQLTFLSIRPFTSISSPGSDARDRSTTTDKPFSLPKSSSYKKTNNLNIKQKSSGSRSDSKNGRSGSSTGAPQVAVTSKPSKPKTILPPGQVHPDMRDTDKQPLNGIFAVYKNKGLSSAKIVERVKYSIQDELAKLNSSKIKIKVGHGGTLDPMAEGVLIIGIGSGTRELTSFLSGSKCYRATAVLGSETDTLDATGKVTEVKDSSHVTLDMINEQIPRFVGKIMQVPPAFSALHVDGERAYDLARKGKTFELKPREVTVYSLKLLPEKSSFPAEFSIDIECGGGFYVRSFLSDIAKSCNALAHMSALVRTKQGQFSLEDCLHDKDWTIENVKREIDRAKERFGNGATSVATDSKTN